MNREHYTTFDDFTLDEITSAVCARLEGSRLLLEEFGNVGDALEGIIDDATDKLRHLQKLSREHDWPEKSATVPQRPVRASEAKITTARLTDKADEAEAGTRELLAALNMADASDMDCIDATTARDAIRGFAKLARKAHEDAEQAAKMAKELYKATPRDRAA